MCQKSPEAHSKSYLRMPHSCKHPIAFDCDAQIQVSRMLLTVGQDGGFYWEIF